MPRRSGLALIVALAALVVYPPPAQVGVRDLQTVTTPGSKVAQPPKPSVTLEHQLIQVEPMRPPKPARLRRALPTTRLAYGPTRQDTLGSRARRAVLGDGRFRPEPFPRLDR